MYQKGTDKIKEIIKCINSAILKAAMETIPRGARSNYRPYWTDDLRELEDELHKGRQNSEIEQSTEANIKLKATAANRAGFRLDTALSYFRYGALYKSRYVSAKYDFFTSFSLCSLYVNPALAAKYKRTLNTNTRNSWREKTERLNLDRDRNKLWKLVKTLNNEDNYRAPIQIFF